VSFSSTERPLAADAPVSIAAIEAARCGPAGPLKWLRTHAFPAARLQRNIADSHLRWRVLAQSYGIAPDPRWIEGAIETAISAVSQLRASSSEVVTPSSQASRRLASGCCAGDEVSVRISHCLRWGR
jgi:hypothetical protein